jgi:hypothetical protein
LEICRSSSQGRDELQRDCRTLGSEEGILCTYIQLPWGYDPALNGEQAKAYTADGGFFVALDNEFKPSQILQSVSNNNLIVKASIEGFKSVERKSSVQNEPEKTIGQSLSRDLNTGPADYKSAALPTKPLRRHTILSVDGKKDGARHGRSLQKISRCVNSPTGNG